MQFRLFEGCHRRGEAGVPKQCDCGGSSPDWEDSSASKGKGFVKYVNVPAISGADSLFAVLVVYVWWFGTAHIPRFGAIECRR